MSRAVQEQRGLGDSVKRLFGGGTWHLERWLNAGYDALEAPLPSASLPPAPQQVRAQPARSCTEAGPQLFVACNLTMDLHVYTRLHPVLQARRACVRAVG